VEAFKQGLREHGYREGHNIILEYRYAEGKYDRLFQLANEFVRAKVDIIVTTSSYSAHAARKATKAIPIVITSGSPVQPGLAESFAKPGGNVTGLSLLLPELSGKQTELLTEAFPKINRVAVLYEPALPFIVIEVKELLPAAARGLGLTIQSWEVRTADDFEKVFATLNKQRPDGLYVPNGVLIFPSSLRNVWNCAIAQSGLWLLEQINDQ
jgi:putative ABC transport system substrate-binding protein